MRCFAPQRSSLQTSYPIPIVNTLLTQLWLSNSEVTGYTHTLRGALASATKFSCQIPDLLVFCTAKLQDSNCSCKKLCNTRPFQSILRPDDAYRQFGAARIVAHPCTSEGILVMNRLSGISGLADQRIRRVLAACLPWKRKKTNMNQDITTTSVKIPIKKPLLNSSL